MGWNSANAYFDTIIDTMIETGCTDDQLFTVTVRMLQMFQNDDWDTYHESYRRYQHDELAVAVIRAFHAADSQPQLGHTVTGKIDYSSSYDEWVLGCDACGMLGRRFRTTAGHDSLVRLWTTHEMHRHGGDGVIETSHLLVSRETTEGD